ncbi:2,3,4,5-tetrahydropyridine-2,6-dicarboxylate N-succinyltransferase [Candidatus Fermentibacteria bacterium]|nr:2,3,4,5-tetrahydropyridine-2,6-dicarboxylate N-succinyltransferase [Candidatus Fermentibacteria bacterium]
MSLASLKASVEELVALPELDEARHGVVLEEFLDALEDGSVRAAEPTPDGWLVNRWVKQGILAAFRMSSTRPAGVTAFATFHDRAILPARHLDVVSGVRMVPGGSAVRRGCHVARGVTIMPPAYLNVGAYVAEGTMVDSHALVGSCAQIGRRVHLSAGCQIGGVLEPVGARPVIIEDDVLVGGNCGVYEGILVRQRAVLASGVVLTASMPIYDLAREQILRSGPGAPLEIPEGAVVVMGTRAIGSDFGRTHGLSLACAVIVKYRDGSTDARVALEDALRNR